MAKKLTKQHKYILAGAMGIIVILLVYNAFFNKKGVLTGNTPQWDEDLYQRLLAYFNTNADSGALGAWLGDIVKDTYNGIEPIHPDYLINGQTTKSGALLAAWAGGYHKNGTYQIDRDAFKKTFYRMFYEVKGQQEAKQL